MAPTASLRLRGGETAGGELIARLPAHAVTVTAHLITVSEYDRE